MKSPSGAGAALTLLNFAPMIDSELARFVLSHYGIPFRESRHFFGWASVLSILHGSTGQVPLLYGSGLRLAGPRAMVEHFDRLCPVDRKLLPARQPLRTRLEADWGRYNGDLGTDAAVVAYFHLLPHRDIMLEPFSRGVPRLEAFALGSSYPVFRGLLSLLLRLSAGQAQDALARVRTAFERTDARLADGRPYLAGDALTLSDISLATSAAPLLLPEGYGSPMPPLDGMPPAMTTLIAQLRRHPTAGFVQRIYAERRASSAAG